MAHSRHEFVAQLNQRLALLRLRFVAALEAMDYELALDFQLEIDDLRRQRDDIQPGRKHFSLMQRAAAAPVAVIMKSSHHKEPVGDLMFFPPKPPAATIE
jgi:hypothetical protein